ncbi:SusD/RagB family nutrient-binding outer membrane lipoprotein [Pedobacter jamesrossensis]|uniref:SusD/RagB family nutrient-binding outer membrane lipoprotein n=1 Tax=Pedobacter jamesrossensis TaxID=1908238 RepID=A0ABV8NLD6_9SPHI
MKTLNRIFFTAILLCLLTLYSGCKKDWLEVNYNPRDLTDTNARPYLLLAPLLEYTADFSPDFDFLSMWMGYWASPTLPAAINITTYNNIPYTSMPSKNLPFLEEKAQSLGMDFYLGIAKTLRALYWSRIVDKINDVPYTEAFKADILKPKYEDGKSIYEDLMKQLTLASSLISSADISKNEKLSEADIMFHGDRIKWLQFINTVKLRLLIHQANRADRADYIAKEIQVIKTQGSGFLPMGTDAAVNPGWSTTVKVSTYFGLYSNNNSYGGSRGDIFSGVNSVDFAHANEYALNLLKNNSDPRIGGFYSQIEKPFPAGGAQPFAQPGPNSFRGSRLGLAINTFQYPYQTKQYLSAVGGSANNGVVSPSAVGIIKGNNMSAWVITSVENAFLQSEAVWRGWIPGDAEQSYKIAVKESFRWLNMGGNTNIPALSDAIFDQWYNAQQNNPQVSWSAAPDKYKLVMFQKYIALNGIDPVETWIDYRRNGRFPDLPVSVDPARVGNTVPFRLAYTSDEIITNSANLQALGPIDMFTGRIWWMP